MKQGKREIPNGPGRPKDLLPKPTRKALGLNNTPSMMREQQQRKGKKKI